MKVVLEHLTKRFPSRNKKDKSEVVAVNDMSFEIPDGKLVGLLGPSACLKSTALNLICGLETPTEGKIFFGLAMPLCAILTFIKLYFQLRYEKNQ